MRPPIKIIRFSLLFLLVIGLGFTAWYLPGSSDHPPARKRLGDIETTLQLPEAWKGDLDEMTERRLVRILVPYSKTLYFIDRGQERGIVHDAGIELQKWLNRKYGSKKLPVRVAFIPSPREFLLDNLADGLGDIAAGNLTITPERLKHVDFTDPAPKPVNEIVVTGPASPTLNSIADLAKVPVYVRKTSSYYEHLVKLDADKKLGLNIKFADETLEDEGLLEMVNAGMTPLAIVDSHKAKFWSHIFKNITLREDLVINQGGKIAWAIRKNSPKLRAELDAFRKTEDNRYGLTNMLLKRYLGTTKYVENATHKDEIKKFDNLKHLFRKYADKYNLDTLLLLAQGYQESRLNQGTRSHAGAVGIMQVLPKTASSPPIEIHDVEKDPEQNIHAGAKYMRHLIGTYLNEPDLDQTNRLLLGLAAYNAGPGNLRKMRKKTSQMNLNPNLWFNHVEYGAAHVIGRETVQYVSNVYKYYLAYRLVEEDRRITQERTEAWKQKNLN